MKRLTIILAMSAISVASIAAELSNREEDVIVVVLGHEEKSGEAILPVIELPVYVLEPTGEVVSEFVPEVVEATLQPVKEEVFHPPKVDNKPLRQKINVPLNERYGLKAIY